MSNTHISVKVLELLKDIRTLDDSIHRKSRTELDSMYHAAENLLNWIQNQARDNNADLSPYFSELNQVDIDLIRLKNEISGKTKTLWEAVRGKLA